MPTKTELEQQVGELVDELAQKQASLDELREETLILAEGIEERDTIIAKLESEKAEEVSDEITAVLDRSCINCGNSGRTSYDAETKLFSCAFCKHTWVIAEERAPFRQK